MMVQSRGVIFWDFDGTLVHFTSWRLALMDVLNECEPGHNIDDEQIRPFLRDKFPWHRPEEPHTHLNNPDNWWRALESAFVKCYREVGYKDERSGELASQVRRYMLQPDRYILYDDVIPVLSEVKGEGWRNVILSNHMPELPDVVHTLGLSPYFDFCITSAATGYEKPNPQAFLLALRRAGNPEKAWMVGDNIISDIHGAEAAGITAILVHEPHVHSNQTLNMKDIRYYSPDLTGAIKIIEGK
jgi:putative hydrolase of the HAD superfamily